MAKVLVTGGAGYIGSHAIVEAIEHGYDVVSIDNFYNSFEKTYRRIHEITGCSVKHYKLDLRDLAGLSDIFEKHSDIEVIIHFAALKNVRESVENPLLYYSNNVGGMHNLLSCMKNYSIGKLIFSSSCSVYGNTTEIPVTESSPFMKAESPYGHTKQICEQMARDLSYIWPEGKFALLRYFNPAGAHDSGLLGEENKLDPFNLVPLMVEAAAGIRDKLTVFGTDYNTPDGSCVRDYIHIQDLASAHIKAINFLDNNSHNKKVHSFNLGTSKGTSVLELIHTFQKANGIKVPYETGKRKTGDVEAIYADCTKAKDMLGWTATRNNNDILKSAWKWAQKIIDEQNSIPLRQNQSE